MRYIHLDPVRAGTGSHPGDYRWSSYRVFRGLRKTPSRLSVDATLKRFGKTRNEQRERYRAFVEEPAEVAQNPLRNLSYGAVLGTSEFVDWVRRTCLDRRPSLNLAHFRKVLPRIPVESLCTAVAAAEGVTPGSQQLAHRRLPPEPGAVSGASAQAPGVGRSRSTLRWHRCQRGENGMQAY